MVVTVPCAHCDGSGARELTDIEQLTLAEVGRDWRTTLDIHLRFPLPNNDEPRPTMRALVMRLQALYMFGLVDRKLATRGSYAWRLR